MLEFGNVVQERYRIVRLLGQGGMGAVYRAWDLHLNVPIALKELRPQPGLDDKTLAGLREQFEQEASVLARLNHPNLVRVTDYFEEQGNAYLVMDYIDGRSLAHVILQDGAQSERRAGEWARQLLEALAYCHAQGVVHRDIKPQNIIVKPDGTVTLVDFGLVKLWNKDDPRTRTVIRGMGTPEYAPPERYSISNDHTGPPSDIYSVGATLYHLLTGRAPAATTERMAIPEAFVPLRRLAPHVSDRFEQLIMRALALSVSDRWQSAREMLAQLISGPLPTSSMDSYMPSEVSSPTPMAPPASPPLAGPPPVQPQVARTSSSHARRSSRAAVPLFIGAGLLVCLFVACFGYFVGAPLVRDLFADLPVAATPFSEDVSVTTSPASSTPTDAVDAPVDADFQITVQNDSPDEVCFVQISPSDSDQWGEDWLGENITIAPLGGFYHFDVAEGIYDVRAQRCDLTTMATWWRLDRDSKLQVGATGATVRLLVQNDTGAQICYLYISPTTADDWGQDWLGDIESLSSGNARVLYMRPGSYDLQVSDCDNYVLAEEYGVSLGEDTTWTVSD